MSSPHIEWSSRRPRRRSSFDSDLDDTNMSVSTMGRIVPATATSANHNDDSSRQSNRGHNTSHAQHTASSLRKSQRFPQRGYHMGKTKAQPTDHKIRRLQQEVGRLKTRTKHVQRLSHDVSIVEQQSNRQMDALAGQVAQLRDAFATLSDVVVEEIEDIRNELGDIRHIQATQPQMGSSPVTPLDQSHLNLHHHHQRDTPPIEEQFARQSLEAKMNNVDSSVANLAARLDQMQIDRSQAVEKLQHGLHQTSTDVTLLKSQAISNQNGFGLPSVSRSDVEDIVRRVVKHELDKERVTHNSFAGGATTTSPLNDAYERSRLTAMVRDVTKQCLREQNDIDTDSTSASRFQQQLSSLQQQIKSNWSESRNNHTTASAELQSLRANLNSIAQQAVGASSSPVIDEKRVTDACLTTIRAEQSQLRASIGYAADLAKLARSKADVNRSEIEKLTNDMHAVATKQQQHSQPTQQFRARVSG